jgi:hypothetical protein
VPKSTPATMVMIVSLEWLSTVCACLKIWPGEKAESGT